MLLFSYFKHLWLLLHILVQCHGNLQPGFSKLQRGHRLDRRVIQSFTELSFLDCVTDCLVTPRCKSVNYFKGANFCETNYENKAAAKSNFVDSAGWVYSEREHWPKELAGDCMYSNCNMTAKCRHKKYSKDAYFECILSDCGLPDREGFDLNSTLREDAIGIRRRLHASCRKGYHQIGSGPLICTSTGHWKYTMRCERDELQYINHLYFFNPNATNWEKAKAYCESKYAYLVEITSEDENNWLRDKLVKGKCNDSNPCSVWTGGTDTEKEGTFIWTGSREGITYQHWLANNPDDYDNNEDCIQMLYNGFWNDLHCNRKLAFICEKNLNE